ncbi:MAG: restriction endonuclease subunit S [Cyanobacteria bacterium P01_A01_bin.116]
MLATIDGIASIDSNLVDPANFQQHPHIAPNHIESNTGRLLNYTTIADDAVTSSKHLFFPGHILYSKIRPYLAKAVLIDFEGLCSADMYPIKAYIDTAYLHRWLISGEFTHLVSKAQGRTVLPKVNQSALKKITIPLTPLKEQHRIVTKIETLTTRSRKARQALDTIPALLDQFRQSVLAAAFRGDLTADWRSQNPDVEPVWEQVTLKEILSAPLANGRSVRDAEEGVPVLRLTCLKSGRIDLKERKIGDWQI